MGKLKTLSEHGGPEGIKPMTVSAILNIILETEEKDRENLWSFINKKLRDSKEINDFIGVITYCIDQYPSKLESTTLILEQRVISIHLRLRDKLKNVLLGIDRTSVQKIFLDAFDTCIHLESVSPSVVYSELDK